MYRSHVEEVDINDFADTQGGVERTGEAEAYDATAALESSPSSQQEAQGRNTIVLKTHDGDGYVLPYLPWETTKSHIEDIYKLRHREALAEAVKEGNFSLMTEGGNIILPSLWDQVVEPAATVQIVLLSEILNPDIAAHYPYYEPIRPSYPLSRPSVSLSIRSPIVPEERHVGVDSEDGNSRRDEAEHGSSLSSQSEEDLDLESTDSESEASMSSSAAKSSIGVVRQVNTPTDEDGNNLVFKVNTNFIGPLGQATENSNNVSIKRDPQQSVGNTESVSITKAVCAQTDGRTSLQIFTLPGPRTSSTHLDESIRWFHLRSSPLDLVGFKESCLSIPGLSKRLQELLKKLFGKVEKEKLKMSLDGMFIEPGTVLRADESQQPDLESVIFSCVPYFDLQIPTKKGSNSGKVTRFSSRTLMQSYYPYEPVQERDAEQAYRKFGNEKRNALIHVPNLWVVNIGSNIVATCGHQALHDGFVQSIKLVAMDRNVTKDGDISRNIRLTDWYGRKLIYTVEECRSYFQMEQKLRELRWCSNRSSQEKSLQLSWQTTGGRARVTPGLWTGILRQRDSLFMDLFLLNDLKSENNDDGAVHLPSRTALPSKPFFHWPQKISTEDDETKKLFSDEIKRSIRCLELVEKAITSEVLSSYGSYSAVERTFTSTEYYRTLTQGTAENVRSSLQSLRATHGGVSKPKEDDLTSHQAIIFRQHNAIAQKTFDLCQFMRSTLALFVADVDKSTMLRKSWAAMQNICDIAGTILSREPVASDSNKPERSGETRPTQQRWFVRADFSSEITSEPLEKLRRSFQKCRKCSTFEIYNNSRAAALHAQKHFKHADLFNSSTLAPNDCIANHTQMKLEAWNRGFVAVLTKSCQKAQQLLDNAQELSDGVLNEDGQMSELYTLPRSLLGAFRQILVFYFAVERAMFYTDDSFKDAWNPFEKLEQVTSASFSPSGLQAIEIFGSGVQNALGAARTELCSMVKSSGPVEVFQRLSLSPEYVCGWFMRRLIVKPLEKSMTVSDMYREYLSTIQFQVNHRPGKRLLRSINLLQEEIAALQEVNTQQSKLISNYMSVLDDTTYENDISNRRAMFPYERMLLESCQDHLKMTDQEYRYLLARCGPLSDSTKQSLEINEEDHGKAILVFTVVTVIFLPLSFVTSYLGMNTTDIRDMGSSSTLFWAIAIPLTTATMGSVMYIGYNGDDLRDACSSLYRTVTGKQDRSTGARGISVAQRKLARISATDSGSALDFSSLADDAEFANPRPEDYYRSTHRGTWKEASRPPRPQYTIEPPTLQWEPYPSAAYPLAPEPRTGLRTQPLKVNDYAEEEWYSPGHGVSEAARRRRVNSDYPGPGADYTASRPNMAGYETIRVDSRPEVRTYEPVTLEIPPTPPAYVRRRMQDEGDWYTRLPAPRVAGQHHIAPPQYEWTKQSHRHHRSTRERPRHRREDRTD